MACVVIVVNPSPFCLRREGAPEYCRNMCYILEQLTVYVQSLLCAFGGSMTGNNKKSQGYLGEKKMYTHKKHTVNSPLYIYIYDHTYIIGVEH